MTANGTQPQILRPSKVTGAVLLVVGIVVAGIGGWRLQNSGGFSVPHLLLILGALSIFAAVQHSMNRIVLLPDRLEFGGLLGRTAIRKEDIESVTWEAGCGVSLRMKAQTWRRVPDLGRAQGVCNSIRAWLKR
jgi:hypothetical protein